MENNNYYEHAIKTARKENYYQVDYANEITRLNVEKQQLISWLEDKIKEIKKENKTNGLINEIYFYNITKIDVYQEVLDFVNEGGKQ